MGKGEMGELGPQFEYFQLFSFTKKDTCRSLCWQLTASYQPFCAEWEFPLLLIGLVHFR